VIPSSDVRKIIWGGDGGGDPFFEATVSGGAVYRDDPAAGAQPVDCDVLEHVGGLADGDRVLAMSAANGKSYVIGKL